MVASKSIELRMLMEYYSEYHELHGSVMHMATALANESGRVPNSIRGNHPSMKYFRFFCYEILS